MTWGTPQEIETRRRIMLAVAAYAYERMSINLISDAEFDEECKKINLSIDTGYPEWDAWWRKNFNPSTGMWINNHPDPSGLELIVNRLI